MNERTPQSENISQANTTSNPVFKFFVAFTAGSSAVIFPRLSASIASQSETIKINFFSTDFILTAIALGALIGLAVMWLEWGVNERPGHTFMVALGIPALFSGGMNTTNAANSYVTSLHEKGQLVRQIQNLEKIDIRPKVSITPITVDEESDQSSMNLFFTPVAHAADSNTHLAQPFLIYDPGLQVEKEKERYAIILESASDKKEAKRKVKSLRTKFPGLKPQAVRTGEGEYLIIEGGDPLPQSEAILEAVRIKKTTKMEPSLLRVR